MNAYTNAIDQGYLAPADRGSVQYVIDDSLYVLARLANSTGILETVGAMWLWTARPLMPVIWVALTFSAGCPG